VTVENLDTDQTLVVDGKATPYLEDLLFQIVNALGGEGSSSVITIIEEAIENPQSGRLRALVTNLTKKVDGLEASLPDTAPLRGLVTRLISKVNGLEASLPDVAPGNQLLAMKKDLEDIKVQINMPINLKSITDRLHNIEKQL